MPRKRSPEAQVLFELEESLTEKLVGMQEKVLRLSGEILRRDKPTIHSFHGSIGSKNNTYVDSVRTKFTDPNDFKARWVRGLRDRVKPSLERGYINAAVQIGHLMHNSLVREYTLLFLERTFYRNLVPRTRDQPDESLWRLWFGDNKMPWA